MKTIICDHCKKDIDEDDNRSEVTFLRLEIDEIRSPAFDLCQNCRIELEKLIKDWINSHDK